MRVLKFGGSSVANATNISRVLDIVCEAASADRVILVCSAIKGCTDTLISSGVTKELQFRHEDIIRRLFTGMEREEMTRALASVFRAAVCAEGPVEAFGEILSTTIIAGKLSCEGISTLWVDSREIIKVGEDGTVDEALSFGNIRKTVEAFPDVRVFVAPGFIASDMDGRTVTLGRGGSDYSAALYAAGSSSGELEIWTDVPGIMTSNPKDVPSAVTIPALSYQSALRLAEHGAKVLYAPTVAPVMKAGIPFKILNTFNPEGSCTIVSDLPEGKSVQWRGVSVTPQGDQSRVWLAGEGPVNGRAALQRMKSALKENGIRILEEGQQDEGQLLMVKVHSTEAKNALRAIHREFFESRAYAQTPVFIAGNGPVGKALLDIISKGSDTLAHRTGRALKVCGLSDSRHYILDMKGIDRSALNRGGSAEGWAFIKAVKASAPRGSVFVDCSSSEDIGGCYTELMEEGISIVSSNRRALSGPYSTYAGMKSAASENGVMFRYDTTVGTALPILESISGSANSCDRILSIRAVVSCTMNYILSAYEKGGAGSLAALLRKAQESGLTERDPRFDLAGKDALRKLLILGREAGIPLEEADVQISPMLPEEYFKGEVDDFYARLEAAEPELASRTAALAREGRRQRFIASIERDETLPLGFRAAIRMEAVQSGNPFYDVSGTENIIAIRSDYIETPLVLKGAGEGASLAAAGIINDILSKW